MSLNRAQRRGHSPTDREERPGSPPEMEEPGSSEAHTGTGDQDVTRLTGPGTGGATETAGRRPHHSGAHISNSTKG
jgi:hypothetical protein